MIMMTTKILATVRAANADLEDTLFGLTFWSIILGVTAICFLSGPFGTLDALPWDMRMIYWALQVSVTGVAGAWTHSLMRTQGWTGTTSLVGISLGFGFVVFGLVTLFSLALLEPIGRYPGSPDLLLYSVPSASLIFLLLALMPPMQSRADAPERPETLSRPRLFRRLKKHHAARHILSLSAQDHYVEVVTDAGAELCLIRLVDAISEAAPEPGFKIHRSHWVAARAIMSLKADGSGAQVMLDDARILPVSRSRLSEFRRFLSTEDKTS